MSRVLMVDDNEAFLKPMGQLLTAKGHDAETVSSGEEAQTRLRASGYDVLITDVSMEPISGLDLLNTAKDEFPGMPVIVLTAFATFEIALDAVKLGAFDLLTKPFRVNELMEAIERAQKWRQAVDSGQTSPPADSYRAVALKEYLRSQVPSLPGQAAAER